MRNAYRISFGKLAMEQTTFDTWAWGYELSLSASEQDPIRRCCQRGNGPSDSIEFREIFKVVTFNSREGMSSTHLLLLLLFLLYDSQVWIPLVLTKVFYYFLQSPLANVSRQYVNCRNYLASNKKWEYLRTVGPERTEKGSIFLCFKLVHLYYRGRYEVNYKTTKVASNSANIWVRCHKFMSVDLLLEYSGSIQNVLPNLSPDNRCPLLEYS
jgi:hypothetical protein